MTNLIRLPVPATPPRPTVLRSVRADVGAVRLVLQGVEYWLDAREAARLGLDVVIASAEALRLQSEALLAAARDGRDG